jgi:WD40 repeat protein
MRIGHSIGYLVAMACLATSCALLTRKPDIAPRAVPQKRLLTIPVALAARGAPTTPSLACEIPAGPELSISALAFSSDGKTLAVGGYQEVLLWDLADAKLLKRIGAGKIGDAVRALVFLKGDRMLAVGEGTPRQSGAVRVFGVKTGRQTREFKEPQDVVYALAGSPEGNLLAAGGADNAIYIWNLDKKAKPSILKEHGDWVSCASFSPDGKFLATGSADKTVRVREVGTTKPIARALQSDSVQSLDYGPNGRFLAAAIGGTAENAVRIQVTSSTPQTVTPPPAPKVEKEPPKAADPKAVSAKAASAKADAAKSDPKAGGTKAADPKAAGAKAAAPTAKTPPVIAKPAPVVPQQAITIPLGAVKPLDVVWAHNPSRVYVACDDGTIKVYDAPSGKPTATLTGHKDWVYVLALSPDGTQLASGSGDGTVKLWNTANGKLLATLVQLAPRTNEWLIVSAQGYFAASSTKALRWNTKNLAMPSAELTTLLQNADSVRKTLAAEEVAPPALR